MEQVLRSRNISDTRRKQTGSRPEMLPEKMWTYLSLEADDPESLVVESVVKNKTKKQQQLLQGRVVLVNKMND